MNVERMTKVLPKAIELHEELEALRVRMFNADVRVGGMLDMLRSSSRATDQQILVALGALRNASDDHIRRGSLMRRLCDLLEPCYDGG